MIHNQRNLNLAYMNAKDRIAKYSLISRNIKGNSVAPAQNQIVNFFRRDWHPVNWRTSQGNRTTDDDDNCDHRSRDGKRDRERGNLLNRFRHFGGGARSSSSEEFANSPKRSFPPENCVIFQPGIWHLSWVDIYTVSGHNRASPSKDNKLSKCV